MNKIKLMYDVVQKIKEKDVLKGELKVLVHKDEEETLNLTKKFEKSSSSCDRKTENEDEQSILKKHFFMHGLHGKTGGFKGKLSGITFLLKLLNDLEAKEENGKKQLALNINNHALPEELRERMTTHFAEKHSGFEKHCIIGCFHKIEEMSLKATVSIEPDDSIDKVFLAAEAKYLDEVDNSHHIKAAGEIKIN